MGNQFLSDVEETTWDSSIGRDLISLSNPSRGKDAFTKLIYGTLLDLYYRIWSNGAKVCRDKVLRATQFHLLIKASL